MGSNEHPPDFDDRELIFVSFAGDDGRRFKDELEPYFLGLRLWHDEQLRAGGWESQIIDRLERCHGAILLVNAECFSSAFVREREIPILLRRGLNGEIPVVPIVASASSSLLDHEFDVPMLDGSVEQHRITELTLAPKGIRGVNGRQGPEATPLDQLSKGQRKAYYDDAARLIRNELRRTSAESVIPVSGDRSQLIAALEAASQDLLTWPTEIREEWIDRPELAQIENRFESSPSSATLLLGPPGSGKSSVLARIAARATSKGWPVLGIKADLLRPTVRSRSELVEALSLPGDPIEVLRDIASPERPCLLLLDQLDVLSGLVERHGERLDVLLNVAAAANEIPHVHVLSSCRAFEYRYDPRLRGLDPDPVHLKLPSLDDALDLLGKATDIKIPPDHHGLDIIRNPFCLKLVVKYADHLGSLRQIVSSQDLLATIVEEALTGGAVADGVRLASVMGERETLWCSTDEPGLPPLAELREAQFVYHDDGRVRFTHQLVFEHFWARAMVQQGVSTCVLAGEQLLLDRPRIRNALSQLRMIDAERFYVELDALWSSDQLQYHLRRLLIDVVTFIEARVDTPTGHDLRWVRARLSEDSWRAHTLRRLVTVAWFDALRSEDLPALMGDRRIGSLAAGAMLHAVVEHRPKEVACLLREHWLRAEYIPSVQRLAARLPWDERWARDLWRLIAGFRECDPAMLGSDLHQVEGHEGDAAEILARRMQVKLEEISVGADTREVDQEQALLSTGWYFAETIVARAPGSFLDRLWESIQGLFSHYDHQKPQWGGYRGGNLIWRFEDKHHGESIVAVVQKALVELGKQDPSGLMALVRSRLRSRSASIHHMISAGVEAMAQSWPGLVVEYLTGEPERLYVRSGGGMPWRSRQLVSLAGTHGRDPDLKELQAAIMALQPAEKMLAGKEPSDGMVVSFRRHDEGLKLWLLEVLPAGRVLDHVQEWMERTSGKLGTRRWDDKEPEMPEMVPVVSPVGQEQFLEMEPERIIELFNELTDDVERRQPRQTGVGGSIEASREFSAAMGQRPERAPEVFRGFSPGRQERPVAYTLREWSTRDRADLVVEWAHHFDEHGFRTTMFREEVAHALRQTFGNQDLQPKTQAMLMRWLDEWHADDPEPGEPKEHPIEEPLVHGRRYLDPHPTGAWSVFEALLTGILSRAPHDSEEALSVLRKHAEAIRSPNALALLSQYWLSPLLRADAEATISIILDRLEDAPHLLHAPNCADALLKLRPAEPPALVERYRGLLRTIKDGPWVAGPQLWAEIMVDIMLFDGPTWAQAAVEEILDGETVEHAERELAGVIHVASEVAATPERFEPNTQAAVGLLVRVAPRVPPAVRSVWMLPLNRHKWSKVPASELLPLLRAAAAHPDLLEAAHEDVLSLALDIISEEPTTAFGLAHGFLEVRHRRGARIAFRENAMRSIIAVLQRTPHHRYNALVLMESLLEHDAYGAEEFLSELESVDKSAPQ